MPHSLVHNNIHKVVEILHQDWQHDINLHEKLIENFEKAEASSMGVLHTIESMLEDKNSEKHYS